MTTYPTYKLGEIVDFYSGYGFPKNLQGKKTGKYPFYKVGDISKNVQNGFSHLLLCDNFIDDNDLSALKGVLLPESTLVFAKIGEALKLNRRALTKELCLVDNNVVGIKAKTDKCLDLYLFYYFKTIKLEKYSRATTVPSVRKSDIELIPIPLPPLATQHAIVSSIETLFAELDKAVQHLRTAQQQIKTYRQAVLNHWLNNEDGKWEMVKLGDVAEVNTGSTPKRGNNDYWENGTIPWITSGETNNQYITKASEFITTKAIAETNCKIIPKGSLLIAMYGEGKTRGKCAELSINAATNQALASITFTSTEISKNFAKCFFEKNYQDMRLLSSGGVQPNLNLGIIKNMIIPLPPIFEQQRIVAEIEGRLSQAETVEESIEKALQQAEALRQSILKKAFNGELE